MSFESCLKEELQKAVTRWAEKEVEKMKEQFLVEFCEFKKELTAKAVFEIFNVCSFERGGNELRIVVSLPEKKS